MSSKVFKGGEDTKKIYTKINIIWTMGLKEFLRKKKAEVRWAFERLNRNVRRESNRLNTIAMGIERYGKDFEINAWRLKNYKREISEPVEMDLGVLVPELKGSKVKVYEGYKTVEAKTKFLGKVDFTELYKEFVQKDKEFAERDIKEGWLPHISELKRVGKALGIEVPFELKIAGNILRRKNVDPRTRILGAIRVIESGLAKYPKGSPQRAVLEMTYSKVRNIQERAAYLPEKNAIQIGSISMYKQIRRLRNNIDRLKKTDPNMAETVREYINDLIHEWQHKINSNALAPYLEKIEAQKREAGKGWKLRLLFRRGNAVRSADRSKIERIERILSTIDEATAYGVADKLSENIISPLSKNAKEIEKYARGTAKKYPDVDEETFVRAYFLARELVGDKTKLSENEALQIAKKVLQEIIKKNKHMEV